MTSAEDTLQRAITYLENLEATATRGPWVARQINSRSRSQFSVCEATDPEQSQLALYVDGPDAALIVALRGCVPEILAILRTAVGTYQMSVTATTSQSRGVDQPPGIHHRDPVAADRTAAFHIRRELALAVRVLEGADQ